jgi:hypothetical protein
MALPTIPLQFADLGNALASGSQARYASIRAGNEEAEERRRVDAQQYVDPAMKGDNTAMGKLAYGDPKAAVAISTALGRMDTNQRAKVKEQAEYSSQSAHAILQANPQERAQIYRDLHAEGVRRGYDMSSLPSEYTPQIDGRLRSAREMAIPVVKWFEQNQVNARHNSPGGGAGGELTPMAGPTGGAPAPAAPPRAPAGVPMSGLNNPAGGATGGFAPPDVTKATSVAQAPQEEGAAYLSADPSIKQPPQRSGPVFYEDPTTHGYVIAQDRRRPGQPVIDEHGIRYVHPQTKEVVIFKPGGEKPKPPAGPFVGQGIEAQYANILQGGNPSSPEYALAYAHFARSRTTIDDQGRPVTVQPMDMSVFRRPTFNSAPPAPSPAAAPAAAPDAPPTSLKLPPMPEPGAPRITVGDPIPGAAKAPNNEQSRDQGFADRMTNSNAIVATVEGQGKSTGGRFKEGIPFGMGNFAQSEDYQKFKQARDDFINAQLRRESGAAIGPKEYENADKQYFPVPGDGPEVIKQKALNRKIAVEAMIKSGGPSYKPRAAESASDPLEGKTATNPQTGEKVIRRGGQWVPQ